jgi:GcrA cell cycle regulator
MPTWTEDRVEALLQLWSLGLSASQIAARIGGISRNAALGKLHRLGRLKKRPTMSTRAAEKVAEARAKRAKSTPDRTLMVMKTPTPPRVYKPKQATNEPAPLATIETDTGSGCRWICGDPRRLSSTVCGHAVHARAWCEHHFARVYNLQPKANAA